MSVYKNKQLEDFAKDMKICFEPSKQFAPIFKHAVLKGLEINKDPALSTVLYSMQLN